MEQRFGKAGDGGLVTLRVARRKSLKFDDLVNETMWIADVGLRRE